MDRGGGAKARPLRVRRRPKLSGDVAAFGGATVRPIRRAFELAASMSLKVWRARRVASRSMRRLAEFAVGFLEAGPEPRRPKRVRQAERRRPPARAGSGSGTAA